MKTTSAGFKVGPWLSCSEPHPAPHADRALVLLLDGAPSPTFTAHPSLSPQPPLVQAIFNRDVEDVRSLLNQKENINVLVSAAQPCSSDCTQPLLSFPAALPFSQGGGVG